MSVNIDQRVTIVIPVSILELWYGTMVDIDAGIVNKEKIQECLEFLNKYHDKIYEK
jgi:hypothetical protein